MDASQRGDHEEKGRNTSKWVGVSSIFALGSMNGCGVGLLTRRNKRKYLSKYLLFAVTEMGRYPKKYLSRRFLERYSKDGHLLLNSLGKKWVRGGPEFSYSSAWDYWKRSKPWNGLKSTATSS